jgi:hypothetical protein
VPECDLSRKTDLLSLFCQQKLHHNPIFLFAYAGRELRDKFWLSPKTNLSLLVVAFALLPLSFKASAMHVY